VLQAPAATPSTNAPLAASLPKTGAEASVKVDLRPKPSRSWILVVAIAVAGAVALAYYVR
jgi:hypothetical protein